MKKILPALVFVILTIPVFSQSENTREDVKTNWNFGALPTITFDTDLGFQYGALVNLFYYGDGSRYPSYNHSLYFEVSRFTKGSAINRFYYDSDQLIPGLQTTFDISYLTDQAYDFYGFNGYDAVVNPGWTNSDNPDGDYISRMFYKYDRKLFRMKLDLQGKLPINNMRWVSGFNLQNFSIASVNIDKLNEGKEGDDLLPAQNGLYEKYKEWGIINNDEAYGGFIPTLKAGLVYDTRDNRPNPMKGIWTEAVIEAAPEFIGSASSFAKFALIHRQYFTIIPNDLSFVYRLAYQSTIAGDVPFYYQSQVMTSFLTGYLSEGLGGSKSIRGINRNRVVGDGFFYGNVELRSKIVRFRFINNNFYIGLNAFTDFGRTTQKIDVEKYITHLDTNEKEKYFDIGSEAFHVSYGAGLRIVMNENFVISADYGRAVDARDGTQGIYIGLNYLF